MPNKWAYRLLSVGIGLASGAAAAFVFKQTWKAVSGRPEAPQATDQDHGWAAILAAAAIEGAIFGVVRAAASRAGAEGVKQLTGEWPE
jgi:CO/xanthine dehydrogenase Mo-binding subunit